MQAAKKILKEGNEVQGNAMNNIALSDLQA